MSCDRALLVVGILFQLFGEVQEAEAQLSKAHQLLVNRGLQIQGMVTRDDVFHLNTYSNAGFTSINWLWESNPSLMGPAPGYPWSRLVLNRYTCTSYCTNQSVKLPFLAVTSRGSSKTTCPVAQDSGSPENRTWMPGPSFMQARR